MRQRRLINHYSMHIRHTDLFIVNALSARTSFRRQHCWPVVVVGAADAWTYKEPLRAGLHRRSNCCCCRYCWPFHSSHWRQPVVGESSCGSSCCCCCSRILFANCSGLRRTTRRSGRPLPVVVVAAAVEYCLRWPMQPKIVVAEWHRTTDCRCRPDERG